MRPIIHMAGFLKPETPVFDIRDAPGEDNGMLVRSNAHADALARVLGDSPLVLVRGHGDTVVGATLKQAVFRAIYTETNAQIQMDALRLGGEVTCLSATELARNPHEIDHMDRPWEIWERRATLEC
jgi:HCOMODA/2-hydroxy-3-carboxy-muconic semialdehyde decarboxylase